MSQDEANERLDLFTQALMAIASRQGTCGVTGEHPNLKAVVLESVLIEARILAEVVMTEGGRLRELAKPKQQQQKEIQHVSV